jgi:hypothetical protein
MTMKTLIAATLAAAALGVAPAAFAQRGYDNSVGQLQGLSVDQAKSQLSYAGYTKARNIKVGGQQFDLWANARARESCIGFTSFKGRVTETRSFDNTECGVVSGRFNPEDLRGLRVDDAKWNLRNQGFDHQRNIRIDGQQWDLWRGGGRGRGECIGFTSYNGRVTGVRDFRDCDGDWDGGWNGRLRLDDLPGMSVDSAKRELSDAGFRKARNINVRGKQWDLWYDDGGRGTRCVGFTSYNGRVTDADEFSERDC